ncbi:MAG: hypothetical protein IKB10_01800 [Alphaproteobacteria bacterium]|nr:hypothetical protein [Alphaproteobacteria bacterium]
MNKLLKLTGVSVVAIMTAMGANAAGYTCEELIEYTSCNTGYALLEGDCVCDGGYYTNGDKCTICPIGTYSSVNASECTTCPTTGLVGPDNNAIVATTASTGSKNISACIIPTNVTIKGETGLYHFKSSCAYSGLTPGTSSGGNTVVSEETACIDAGGDWSSDWCDCTMSENGMFWNFLPEHGIVGCFETSLEYMKLSCEDAGATWTWPTDGTDNYTCECPDGAEWMQDSDESGYCWR